jgi:hypothetical protein
MASRGMSTGVGIILAILGIVAVVSLVFCVWFIGQAGAAKEELAKYKASVQDFVRDGEQNSETVREMVLEAKKQSPPQSVATYLTTSFRGLSEKVSGVGTETPASLARKIESALTPLGKQNLLQGVDELGGQVLKLQNEAKAADASRQQAVDNLKLAQDRIKSLEDAHQETIKTLSSGVDTYKGQIDQYKTELDKRVAEMTSAIDKIKRDANDEIAKLNDRISRQTEELLVAQGKLRALQGERGKDQLRPGDEAALVDGEVVALVDADNTVFLNRGKNQRVTLGMTFEVYGEPSDIRLGADGSTARGKGSVEVIRVDDNSSTARITRATRGNPISRGDVLVNPVYDPKKVYTFVVYGNFDTNGDGRQTPDEASDISALIKAWGGKTADAITGDVDFVVLGTRPVVPPAPPADAPVEFVDRYIRLQKAALDYDKLLEQAGNTSMPVLNQNRLMTLIGK